MTTSQRFTLEDVAHHLRTCGLPEDLVASLGIVEGGGNVWVVGIPKGNPDIGRALKALAGDRPIDVFAPGGTISAFALNNNVGSAVLYN